MKLAFVLAAALAVASPAFAKKTEIAQKPPVTQQCLPKAKLLAAVKEDNATVAFDLTGDDLKKFNDFLSRKSKGAEKAPDDITELLVLDNPKSELQLVVSFVKDCVHTAAFMPRGYAKDLLDKSKADVDGKI